jgi:hypothetical protein
MVKGELKHIEYLERCLKNKLDVVARLEKDLIKYNDEANEIWSDLKYSKLMYKENNK